MASNIKFKRSAVQNRVPTTAQLDLGELALNTYDGKLYTEINTGSAAVVEIGSKLSSLVVDGDNGGGGGDVTFHGTTAGRDLTWDFSDNSLRFADNVKAKFGGTSGTGDLEIYHDSSSSYIRDIGTGNLLIGGNNLYLTNNLATKYFLQAINGAQVDLYHNNAIRITTTADGADISGTGSLKVPVGTTAQRNSSPAAGDIRYNSTLGAFEGYSSSWGELGGGGIGIGSTAVNPASGLVTNRIGVGFTDINVVGTGISVTGYGSTIVLDFNDFKPGSFNRSIHNYTATAGQTTFAGLSYDNAERQIAVYLNGARLSEATYTATSGTTVVLDVGASVGDEVEIINININSDVDRNVNTYTATAGQTTFTGLSYNSITELDVYLNGIRLATGDYTATTGNTVVLNVGASVNDIVDIVSTGDGVSFRSTADTSGDKFTLTNVGIGTDITPDKLNVRGNVNIVGVTTLSDSLRVGGHSVLTGTPHDYNYGRGGQDGGLSVYAREAAIEVVGDDDGSHGGSILIRTPTEGFGFIKNPSTNSLELKAFTSTGDNFTLHNTGNNVSNLITQLRVVKDGAVELYNNGSKKFETTSYGVLSTEAVKINGNFIEINNGADSQYTLNRGTTQLFSIRNNAASGVHINTQNSALLCFGVSTGTNNGSVESTLSINSSGNVGIDNQQASEKLHLADSKKLALGNSADLKIYHDGSHSYIDDTGTGNLKLRSNNFRVSNADESKLSATFVPSGAVELYHNNTRTFQTTSFGAETIFTSASGVTPIFKVLHGNLSQGVGIGYHSVFATGANVNVQLKLMSKGSSDLSIQTSAGENMAIFRPNESAYLYYDDSQKFKTTSTGAKVTGNLEVTGVLTYDDVTNVDSVGIITARQGVHIDDSITHIGDTDTKIRFPTANKISLEAGGTTRIQTTSTGAQIDTILLLNGAAGNPGRLRLQEGGALCEIMVARNTDTSSFLYFKTEISGTTATRVVIDESGHLRPFADSTYDLGITGTRWRNVYADTLYGDGSNITAVNATTLDSIDSGSFLRSDAADTASANITINGLEVGTWVSGSTYKGIFHTSQSGTEYMMISQDDHTFISATAGSNVYIRNGGNDATNQLIVGSGNNALTWRGNKVFHAGNDGSGSGLDADTVDGIQGASFLRSDTADTASGDITFSGGSGAITLAANSDITFGTTGTWSGEKVKLQHHASNLYIQGGTGGINLRGSDAGTMAHFGNTATTLYDPVTFSGGAGAVTITSSDIRSNGTSTWTGNPGASTLKIQAHSNRWYIVANSNSSMICQFRQDGSDRSYVANDGQLYHTSSDKYWRQGNDGSGSGLDADTLDGVQGSSFLRSDANDTTTGIVNFTSSSQYPININGSNDGKIVVQGSSNPYIRFREATTDKAYIQWNSNGNFYFVNQESGEQVYIGSGANGLKYVHDGTTSTVWHSGNDGTGTGLDADTVDGIQGANFVRSDTSDEMSGNYNVTGQFLVGGNFTNNSYNSVSSTRLLFGGGNDPNNYHIGTNLENFGGNYAKLDLRWHTGIRMGAQAVYGGIRFFNNEDLNGSVIFSVNKGDGNTRIESGELYHNTSGTSDKYWREGNDGSGSGLDADTLDGVQGSSFLRSDTADTTSGDITFSGGGGAVTIGAGSDIRLSSGGWTGDAYGKIQHHNNHLYFGGGSSADYSFIFRYNNSDKVYIKNNGTIWPQADNTSDLGTTSNRWRNIYTNDLNLSNEGVEGGNDVDGTWGDWTLQEGEEEIFMINNRTGKKYAMMLREVA